MQVVQTAYSHLINPCFLCRIPMPASLPGDRIQSVYLEWQGEHGHYKTQHAICVHCHNEGAATMKIAEASFTRRSTYEFVHRGKVIDTGKSFFAFRKRAKTLGYTHYVYKQEGRVYPFNNE